MVKILYFVVYIIQSVKAMLLTMLEQLQFQNYVNCSFLFYAILQNLATPNVCVCLRW